MAERPPEIVLVRHGEARVTLEQLQEVLSCAPRPRPRE